MLWKLRSRASPDGCFRLTGADSVVGLLENHVTHTCGDTCCTVGAWAGCD